MKIISIETHLIHTEIPSDKQVTSGAGTKFARQAALVEVHTDEGISGVGPCSFGSASLDLQAVKSLVDNVFAPEIVGREAGQIERIWEHLYHGVILRVLGNRGMGLAILSGLDIALWDLKGKALGAPIHDLLGGAVVDRIHTYASSVYWGTPAAAAAEARSYVDQGYQGVKLKIGTTFENDLASAAAIREEVGPGIDLMIDANMSYSANLALRMGRELQDLDVLFFEEPLPIDDLEGHRRLTQCLDLRIATGENMYTRWAFRDFVDAGAIDILQPDPSRTGGISEVIKIAELAAVHHLLLAPHTFSDAFSLAASVHLCAARSTAFILEVDQTYNPLMAELVDRPMTVSNGAMPLPTRPGLGIELDRDFVADHPYNGERGIGAGFQPKVGLAHERAGVRS